MAKKLKRQVRKETASWTADSAPVVEMPTTPRPSNFNPDYTHVIQDLRRIGILAGSFIVILVALSFILR